MLFVKSIKEGVYRSADRTPLAAAVLFISTRVKGYPRLLHEIEEVSSVPIRMINKWQRDICDSFKILLPPFRFFTLIPRIAQKLRMTTAQIEQCRQTCLNIEESKLLDSITPQAVAAAAVLLTCSVSDTFSHQLRRLDTKAIAAVSYTTAKSVQNAFNIISPYADQLSTHLRARCTSSSSSVSASASASASASNGSLANSIEVMAIHTTDDEKGEYKDKGSKETETNTDSSSSGSSGGSSSSRPLSAGRFNMRPRSGSLCSNASITSASIQIKKGKIVDCSLSLDT